MQTPRRRFRKWLALAAAAALTACGGGSDGSGSDGGRSDGSGDDAAATDGSLRDGTAYSSEPAASLDSAAERAATRSRSITFGGATVAYTATTGHLNAIDPRTGAAEASVFYVAYTVPGVAAANRPLVFFYNGGPGSASVWLHLGSFAPRRVVTHAPATTVAQPYELVDNAESLIDVADLVFVDAVGSGWSQAIAPFTNRSFWGVDADAGLMRDFIARYVAVNGRAASPTHLLGESYGTTRSAVLAELMLAAGMRLDGVVLLSSILDYNANCDVFAPAEVSCAGSLPSYGTVGAWFGLSRPVPSDADLYAKQLRSFAGTDYGPAVAAWLQTRQPAPVGLVEQLVDLTGAAAPLWLANLDLDALTFRSRVLPGRLTGRYDARITAEAGSSLTAGGDPSSTLITAPFAAAARHLFENELGYSTSASYTLLAPAIDTWDFRHDGRDLPDVLPDLAAALIRKPSLRVLSLAGYHDLATPFHQTEIDLRRLGATTGVTTRVYPGGHMIYLDDGSRAKLRSDLRAFIDGLPVAVQRQAGDGASPSSTGESSSEAEPSFTYALPTSVPETGRASMAQGGDPYVPGRQGRTTAAPSPSGAALQALARRKITEQDRDVYR